MALLPILKAGNPLLREQSGEVDPASIPSEEMASLLSNMFETMAASNGQGLAAPQVGILKRIVVVRLFIQGRETGTGQAGPEIFDRVLINPEVKVLKGPIAGSWEGCLSLPGMAGYVERSRKIQLRFLDEEGSRHEEIVEGYEAVVYQHECDHLDGVLYIDRLADSRLFGFDEDLDTKGLRQAIREM